MARKALSAECRTLFVGGDRLYVRLGGDVQDRSESAQGTVNRPEKPVPKYRLLKQTDRSYDSQREAQR